MALRIFQFGIVFAIGLWLGPASLPAEAVDANETPLSIQLKDPDDVIVSKGQSAVLRCDVKSAFPNLEVLWLHNDKIIPTNDTRRHLEDDGSLYFPKVGGKKGNGLAGEYRCLARNSAGAVLSSPAKLKIASFDRDFTKHPSNLSVPESQPAVLFCNIHSVPAAEIQWERDTILLPHNERYVPLPTGALLITKTHSSDAGLYRCKATHTLLKKTKHSKIVELTVTSSPMNAVAPTFLPLDILPSTTVLVGENINLYCAVSGWPIPTVQWLNNNSIVISNSSVLQIKNASSNDGNNYTCKAYNNRGKITQQFSIEVQQKPHFNITPVSITYPSARTVRLDCQAIGMPEPKVHWLKNGEPLTIGGRLKKQSTGLVFSHTFTYDAGIYQCVAANAAGRVWAAVQLVLASPYAPFPSPPENVQCRSFDETNICLTWRSPKNVSAQAYSIYSFYKAKGTDISGPEYVTNTTYYLAYGLNSSTNYSFYIRLYSISASDHSETVTCETGVKGNRNLQVKLFNETSVELTWSKISTDTPCNGTNESYKVQWRRKSRIPFSTAQTQQLSQIISGLSPKIEYIFSVVSTHYKNENSPWISFTIPANKSSTEPDFLDTVNSSDALVPPEHLEANSISATVINLTWSDINANTKFYTVSLCNADSNGGPCEERRLIRSELNSMVVDKLQPNTQYEIRVRAHSTDFTSPYSQPVEFMTPADVPSPVSDLKYKLVNETAACLRWRAPLQSNGHLISYIILYTPDSNRPLDEWLTKMIPISQRSETGCWLGDSHTFSTWLLDLEPNKEYMILVRAKSEIGMGRPTVPIKMITDITTDSNDDGDAPNSHETLINSQKIGIIMGVTIACACIIFCISCILVRKQCLKNRSLARARTTASSNYYPAIAHYASEGTSVQVRLEDPCSAEIHEIEHLVSDDSLPHMPAVTPTHLDTKGTDGFPNGHINGSAKSHINGHVLNGNVRITENPRYYALECNGHAEGALKRDRNLPTQYEEDSNSNLKTFQLADLYRPFGLIKPKSTTPCNYFFRNPKSDESSQNNKASSFKETHSSASSSEDISSLNATQLTCLDNSLTTAVNNQRRMSPLLGPNG